MLYRKLGKTGVDVSVLGFGCMRLPVAGGRNDRIDESLATRMLHYAVDCGVNYVDTAYPYHSAEFPQPGESEPFLGRALAGGWRDRVGLATKLPCWMVNSRDDMRKLLDAQLARLGTDRIDFYLLHSLNKAHFPKLRSLGVFEFLDSAVKSGKIRFAGFSFHDELPLFKEIIDSYDWPFCQIQLNYMDADYQAGLEGASYAAGRGVGVVVMEPLRGGSLASGIPADVAAAIDGFRVKRSPAEWALRYVWDLPQVSIALSGMGSMKQVEDNVAFAESGRADSLAADERALVSRLRELFRARIRIGCTACRYCMPCPNGVDIPGCFTHYNNAFIYDNVGRARFTYSIQHQGAARASGCTRCGHCEPLCPQKIPIIDKLADVARLFDAEGAQ